MLLNILKSARFCLRREGPGDQFGHSRLPLVVLGSGLAISRFFPGCFRRKAKKMRFPGIIPQTLLQHE